MTKLDIDLKLHEELTTEIMTVISLDSFRAIWETTENEQWDDFIKDRLNHSNEI